MPKPVWLIGVDLLMKSHGVLQMFLFMLEETTQALGMSVYVAYQAKDELEKSNLAAYALREVIEPTLSWIDTFGSLVYPLNIVYEEFFKASKISMMTMLQTRVVE